MSTQTEHGKKSSERLVILALVFIVPILAIILLVKQLSPGATDPQAMTEEAIASRIAPVAQYNTGAPAPVIAGTEKREPYTGEQLYNKLCMSCHSTGLLDSPKLGDNAAWGPRIAAGEADVYNKAINGFNAMPARGGDATLSDLEVKRAVVFMVNQSGGNFAEPTDGDAAPAADAPAAAPAAEAAPATTTEQAVEAAKEVAADTAAAVNNTAEAAVEATKEAAADAATAVSNTTEAAVEATKEAAADAATAVSNTTEAAVEATKEAATDAAKAVENATEATVEATKEAASDAAKAVENATSDVPLNKQPETDSTASQPAAQ